MALVLVVPDLDKHAFEFAQGVYNPKVSENIDQALVYLIGHDKLNDLFRFIGTDSSGRLLVNTEALAKKTGVTSSIPVDVTVDLIISENDDRNQLDLYNNGANTVFIGFTNTVTALTGFPIPPGFSFSFNNYAGPVFGITSVGASEIRVMEVS